MHWVHELSSIKINWGNFLNKKIAKNMNFVSFVTEINIGMNLLCCEICKVDTHVKIRGILFQREYDTQLSTLTNINNC